MSRTTKTEAIVLRKKSLLGRDVSVTFFTSDYGKVSAIAKGIKKITSRRAAHVQTGNLLSIVLYNKNDRFYLQETSLLSAFSSIKASSQKIDYQYLMFFILDRVLPENQQESVLFNFIKRFIVDLAKLNVTKSMMLSRLTELLKLLGFYKNAKTYPDLIREIEEIIHEKIPQGII